MDQTQIKNPKTTRVKVTIDENFGFTDLSGAARITGLSKSALYKLTATQCIRCYKPSGKLIFKICELISWIENAAI